MNDWIILLIIGIVLVIIGYALKRRPERDLGFALLLIGVILIVISLVLLVI